ncbi:MAG: periplasmic heavy metal sensor [Opitutales bacterium]
MKKSTLFTFTLLAALGAGGAIMLKAQDKLPGAMRWQQRGWASAQQRLGLTDDQVAKIKAELRTEKEPMRTLALKWHDARIALRETIKQPKASEAEVRAAAAKVAAVEADLAVLRARLYTRISPLLNREQLDKVAQREHKVDEFVDARIVGSIDRLVE